MARSSINTKLSSLIEQFDGVLEWATAYGLGVSFEATSLDDAAMTNLTELWPQVACLNLSETKITDDGLGLLQYAIRLEVLEVNGTAITLAGLQELRQLPALVEIQAGDTALAASDVVELLSSGWDINIEVHRRGDYCGWMPEMKELMARWDLA
ncbi:hypothetical protein GC163_14260 [bacterium]|nr:hypothetical protein [bacterium]